MNKEFRRAAKEGDMDTLKRLVAAGADVNSASKNGRTALHYLIEQHLHVARYLLDNKADPNVVDHYGFTPCFFASELPKTLALLIEYKADVVNPIMKWDKKTTLHFAMEQGGNIDCVRMLLAAGARVNALTVDGETPLEALIWASDNVYWPCKETWQKVDMLLEAGADTKLLRRDSRDPFRVIFDARRRAKQEAALVYGIMRKRYGLYRDVCNLVAQHIWNGRLLEEN